MFLTDREFWLNYWESHREEILVKVPEKNMLAPVFDAAIRNSNIKNSCELGGFPGTYSIYLRKKYGLDTTLVDYIIHQDILNEMLTINELNSAELGLIEADIFNYEPTTSYELVFSIGLIEHFESTEKVISLHIPYIKPGGTLVIFLPNFRGVNGWFQRKFDSENYGKHNISSMDVDLLRGICKKLGLEDVQVNWFGRFGVWLEREHQKSIVARVLKKVTWLLGKVIFKVIPIDTKLFSPYIVLTAKRKM